MSNDARQWLLEITMRLSLALLCMLPFHSHAETLTGYVVGISDGDTLTVLDKTSQQHKIRLAGIDAPEKAQAFGDRSKQNLAALTFNRKVVVEWTKHDRYGRTVGKVLVNGVDANLEQIKGGMAWWYRDYAKEQSPEDRRLYEYAEAKSQSNRSGLWSDKNAMPPWDFRHGTGAAKSRSSQPLSNCPCSSGILCTGPKGGRYCITSGDRKSYK